MIPTLHIRNIWFKGTSTRTWSELRRDLEVNNFGHEVIGAMKLGLIAKWELVRRWALMKNMQRWRGMLL